MKHIALVAVTSIIFTGGMFAGLVEKQVAEVRGEAPISEAHAADNADQGVCKGFSMAMCYPAECLDDTCPTNNQCTGNKKCNVEAEVVGPGLTAYSCKLSVLCDSSKDALEIWDIGDDAFATPGKVLGDAGGRVISPAVRSYTSYY